MVSNDEQVDRVYISDLENDLEHLIKVSHIDRLFRAHSEGLIAGYRFRIKELEHDHAIVRGFRTVNAKKPRPLGQG